MGLGVAMRLFLLLLLHFLYHEALAGGEIPPDSETCSADDAKECDSTETYESDSIYADSEHSSEFLNGNSGGLPSVSGNNDMGGFPDETSINGNEMVESHDVPDNLSNETVESHDMVPDNLSNETVESHDMVPDNLSNETVESHDMVPDNLSNETVESHDMVPDNLNNETVKSHGSLNCTCSTQNDESHDIMMSRLTGGDANEVEGGEFKCKFYWNDKELKHLKEKVLEWMKERQKTFNRFTVPVMGYNNTKLPMYGSNFTGVLTWVWLSKQQKYMLHFPHNFVSISTATMGVITQDWALDYDKSLVPPLRNHSIDIKAKIYQHERSLGYCDPECLNANQSCGLGKHEMVKLLTDIGNSTKDFEFEWDRICLQLNYDDIHYITQTKSNPNFVIPDVLYYALFLRKLLIERPWLGFPTRKDQFLHYYCYEEEDSKFSELHEKYIIIPVLAAILWLYFPLLIHYFPSSSKEADQMTGDFQCPNGMFPTHKVPIYFGRWLKWLFCFYTEGDSILIRVRRVIFLIMIFLSAFRLFFLPSYGIAFLCIALILIIATACPAHLSSYIVDVDKSSSNTNLIMLGWNLDAGLIKVNPALKEYQLLASMMQERMYLITDRRFWQLIFNNSFYDYFRFVGVRKFVSFFLGVLYLVSALFFYFSYYSYPLLYFVLEVSTSIVRFPGPQNPSLISVIHRILIFTMFIYSVVVAYFWCYAIIEFSMFTLFGGVISPKIIFPYFVLVGALVGAIYSLVHSLHEHYNEIMTAIVDILDTEGNITAAISLDKTKNSNIPSISTVSVTSTSQKQVDLLKQTVPITYISKDLYDYVVENCSPVRRYVFFIFIQVIAIFVYALIAMSIKNVFHLEDEVDTIFELIGIFAITFVPGLLRFLAYKSHFGKKSDVLLKKKIYFKLVEYISQLP